ncbi:MAG: NTP transferase domain-containing protein, partial [Pseudonocardiaceae bacterium]
MHACILSTGFACRLGGAVASKALIPFLGRPLVDHMLEVLSHWGVEAATLLARGSQDLGVLQRAVDDAALPCTAAHADDWLGVFGWLQGWAANADVPMLIVNGDLLLSRSWGMLSVAHRDAGADLTMAATRVPGGDG